MKEVFLISKEAIKKLNDEQARELVARLCRAECRTLGLPESSVTWGGNQRAKDGGVDVRVKLASSANDLDFIPKSSAAFQVKAETFPPSKISAEVAPDGKARAIYAELAKENGAYVIISTRDDCSHSALKERTDKINETLASIGFASAFATDFYCSRRLADWIEQYPPIVTWVRSVLGEPVAGWRPYGAWAYKEHDVDAEYLVDDRVRIFIPGEEQGEDVAAAIGMMRSELQRPCSIRIVGLSGVGKTRLVQAIFDKRLLPDQLIPSAENVIYCDLADDPEPLPSAMIEALASRDSDAILVVDNCSPAEHARLTEKALIPGRRLKLVTIEYDIRDDVPESTSVYRLEGSSRGIIVELLKRHYGVLSSTDAERIAEYSDGNARVAFALASTAEKAGEFARLRNSQLFDRLFRQKKAEDEGLLRSAEAASLIYSFDGETSAPGSEMAMLAAIAECSISTFQRHMTELSRRGLLQKRGIWRAVLPHAIANQLATRALESLDTSALTSALFMSATKRVARSFSKRLSYLHNCPPAVAIARHLLSEVGPLGDVRTLDEFQRQMFANLAPLRPELALACIERAQANSTFISTENLKRTDFVRVARSIAYDEDFFERGAEILVTFSIAEPTEYNREPTKDALVSLFHIVLSGTRAPLDKRLNVARALLNSHDRNKQTLGFDVLGAGLKVSHFSSHYSFEFGSLHRDYGWSPSSENDAVTWFSGWLDLAREVIRAHDDRFRWTRIVLGDAFRGLWGVAGLRDQLVDLAHELTRSEPWPEGWLATKSILRWDAERQGKASAKQLRELEEALRPKDLPTEIRARVLARGALVDDLEDVDRDTASASSVYEKARTYAEKLGEAAANNNEVLYAFVPEILTRNGSDKAYSFGRGIGKAVDEPAKFIEVVRNHLAALESNEVSLISIRGFIFGWSEVDRGAVEQFLDGAVVDEVWSRWFVELQVQGSMDDRAFERLMKAIGEGRSPVWQFRYLAGGRATDPFTVRQIQELVNAINAQGSDGCFVAFDLLSMVIHCANDKDEEYRDELQNACLDFLRNLDWTIVERDHGGLDYDVDVVLRFALSGANSQNEVNRILQNIIDVERRPERYFSGDRARILEPFFEFFPMMALNAIYQPDENGSFDFAYNFVMDSFSDSVESALKKVPAEILVEWCGMSPTDRYPFAAATCQLFEVSQDESKELSISRTAIMLMHHAPDKLAALKEFVPRFRPKSWSGSCADILERRMPLLELLNPDNDRGIATAVRSAEADLRKLISAERGREAREERSDSGSFE